MLTWWHGCAYSLIGDIEHEQFKGGEQSLSLIWYVIIF